MITYYEKNGENTMELSKRLQTVADAVIPGHRIADVGTDHGYIPIYLVKNGLCPNAYAMDINEGPLARAKEHIEKEGLSGKIETRRSDGLKELRPEEVDTIIIAGMGGELICRILQQSVHFLTQGKELILQPQSEWFKVRHYLHKHGYHIKQEWFLKEDGKYYVIMKAVPVQDKRMEKYPSAFMYAYGKCLLDEKNPVLIEYLKNELEKKQRILRHMDIQEKENMSETEEENVKKRQERYKQLEKEISEIKEYIF